MNALTIFALLLVALVGTGCDYVAPRAPTYTGVVMEIRGECHTIIGDPVAGKDGAGKPERVRIRYALKAEDSRRLGLKPGQRVSIRARVAEPQAGCAGAVLLWPEG